MNQLAETVRKVLLLSIILSGILFSSKAGKPFYLKRIGVFYGVAFRFDNTYRHVLTFDNFELNRYCIGSNYVGFGLNAEFTSSTNFAFGFRFYQSPRIHHRTIGRFPIFYWAIAPSVYSIGEHQGLNIAPEIGAYWDLRFSRKMGSGIHLYYGYDIPIVNKRDYSLSKHHLTLKVGFIYNTKRKTRKNCSDTIISMN